MKKTLTALMMTTFLVSGCNIQSFEDKCKEKGGTVQVEKEDCKKSVTTTDKKTKKKETTKKSGKLTEKDCIKDDEEIDESEGPCLT